MNINLNLANRMGSATPTLAYVRPSTRSPDHKSPSVSANISSQAQELSDAALEAESQLSKTAELKSYIKSIDFTNVSPKEVNELAVKLFKSGELSSGQAGMFMGVEQNTVQEKDPSEKINLIDHFNMMLDAVVPAARTDSTLNVAVTIRKESIDILKAIQDFAVSDRKHILGGK